MELFVISVGISHPQSLIELHGMRFKVAERADSYLNCGLTILRQPRIFYNEYRPASSWI